MRSLFATTICIFFSAVAATQAEESRRVESAPQRWAAGGAGGTPDFIRHVVPLFSKLGCNMRSCHGSFQGQNGFRLSLFGFEPDLDRMELFETDELSEGDGPRVNIKQPAESLFLLKPTSSEDEHGGGQRMGNHSWQYRTMHQWIEAGAVYDPPTASALVRFETTPVEIVFTDRSRKSQLRAVAWFDDGTHEDVTGLTVFPATTMELRRSQRTAPSTCRERAIRR